MTDDDKALVYELRKFQPDTTMCNEAADRIEALSAKNERLLDQLSGISGRLEAMHEARMEERAAIVAWLRKDDFLMTADAIEAGEHLK